MEELTRASEKEAAKAKARQANKPQFK